MRHDIHPFNFDSTINTRHQDIRADCLMLLDIPAHALGLTLGKRFTLDGGVLANRVVISYLFIGQHFLAT